MENTDSPQKCTQNTETRDPTALIIQEYTGG